MTEHKGFALLSGKESLADAGDMGLILRWNNPLEGEMATHSSILAWVILWTEEPGGYSQWHCKKSDATDQLSIHAKILFQFSSFSCVRPFATPWTTACQTSLPITNSQSLLKLMSIESTVSSNHLILCCPLLFLTSIFPSIRVFSSKSVLRIRWPKY